MIYYILGGVLILFHLLLSIWAIVDIFQQQKNKGLIFLILFSPFVGPMIYFQSKS